jgi:two-component system LytT family sensor kinase
VVVEQGRNVRIERSAAEPLVLTLPKLAQLDANQRFRYAADAAVIWMFFFLAWSAFYVATQAQSVAMGAQRRAAEAESAAQAAQLRALRYQVNPHFLFNTLNSLSSLIMAGRAEEAESMVLKLSTFFRQSLTLDAGADISLAEEIALQRLYLDIERVRFPRRLKVEVDVPPRLEKARLPALILQPLVENAIKHAVSPTRDTVILRISAREAGPGRFAIEIENRGGRPLASKVVDVPGTGVGMANVCQRLSARFGSLASCTHGPTDEGGYRVELLLPLDLHD